MRGHFLMVFDLTQKHKEFEKKIDLECDYTTLLPCKSKYQSKFKVPVKHATGILQVFYRYLEIIIGLVFIQVFC